MESDTPPSNRVSRTYGWLLLATIYLPGWFFLWRSFDGVAGVFFHPGVVPALFLFSGLDNQGMAKVVCTCIVYIVVIEWIGLRLRAKRFQWLWLVVVLLIQSFQAWWLDAF